MTMLGMGGSLQGLGSRPGAFGPFGDITQQASHLNLAMLDNLRAQMQVTMPMRDSWINEQLRAKQTTQIELAAKIKPKTLREELQAEVDDWLPRLTY